MCLGEGPMPGCKAGGYSSHWVSGQGAQWTLSTLPAASGEMEGIGEDVDWRGPFQQGEPGPRTAVAVGLMWVVAHLGLRVLRKALASQGSKRGPGST